MELDDRKKKILSSVVEDYIANAQPVGSKALVDKYHLDYSSATIRNEMKLLEDEGYLEQPHISAGRVPSTKGYRYYVDNLMKDKKLSMIDINYIDNSITGFGDTEKLLEQAADVVSKLLLRPTMLTLKKDEIIENIKVMRVSDNLLLVILMSKNGTVKDCFAKLDCEVNDKTIEELSSVLNKNLKGTPFHKVHIALNEVIQNELSNFSFILGKISDSIKYEMSKESKKLNSNVESILELPEFADIEKVKNFVNVLSAKSIVDDAVTNSKDEKLGIIIGNENNQIMLKDYSIISLDITKGDENIGKISVVSPTRIDYSKTVSTLKYINEKFKSIFLNSSKEDKDVKKG